MAIAGPLDNLVNLFLQQSIREGASHLYLESSPAYLKVRTRVDDRLREVITLPLPLAGPLAEAFRRRAQASGAGRRHFWETEGGKKCRFDLRPSQSNDLVVRITPLAPPRRLSDLSLSPAALDPLSNLLKRRSGLIVLSGPERSGRSTLMAALLMECARRGKAVLLHPDWHTPLPGVKQFKTEQTLKDQLASVQRQNFEFIGVAGPCSEEEMARLTELSRSKLVFLIGPERSGTLANIHMTMLPALCSCRFSDELHDGECLRNGCEKCRYQGVAGRLPLVQLKAFDRYLTHFSEEAQKLVKAGLVERQATQQLPAAPAQRDAQWRLAS